MMDIALLVFDEAHHCSRDHAANQIMQRFYHPEKLRGTTHIPYVLGLTASPVMSKKGGGLESVNSERSGVALML